MKILKEIVKRTLGLPFVAGLTLVAYSIGFIDRMYLFIRYGGEWITYERNMNRKTIQDVYEQLTQKP